MGNNPSSDSEAQPRTDTMRAQYLTCPEDHPVVELGPFLLLGVFHLLPPDADCHGAKVLINSEVVLMLCDGESGGVRKKEAGREWGFGNCVSSPEDAPVSLWQDFPQM